LKARCKNLASPYSSIILSRTGLGYGQRLGRIMAGWMQPSRWLPGTTKGQAQATPKAGEQTEQTSSFTSRLRPPLSRSPSPVSLALSLIPCGALMDAVTPRQRAAATSSWCLTAAMALFVPTILHLAANQD
jgi:hypothetical protein